MNLKELHSRIGTRRAELMVELFIQELGPRLLQRSSSHDLGYDLLVGFANKKGGMNTFAIQIAATARPPAKHFQIPKSTFERLAHSNIPAALLVADVKQNRLYYGWLNSTKITIDREKVSVPVIELTETTTKELKARFKSSGRDLVMA